MRSFEFLEPNSVEEACQMLSEHGEDAKILAGGTALVKLIKKKLIHPAYVLNLKSIDTLHFLGTDKGDLKIGALTTLREVEASPLVRKEFQPIVEMVHLIGSQQIRNVGTLAGNICLADPAADPPPLLIALEARLKLVSSKGERVVGVEDFFRGFYETALQPGEILEEIQIPSLSVNSGIVYLKHAMRAAFDIAILGVAVALHLDSRSGVCQDSKIVLGGVITKPVRALKAEDALRGKVINPSSIQEAAKATIEGLEPVTDIRGSRDYRMEMTEVFVQRGIQMAVEWARRGKGS